MEGTSVFGNHSSDFWLFDGKSYDLTRSRLLQTSPPPSRPPLKLPTATLPVLLSVWKTALVIVDMQNFFLSPALGRPPDGPGHAAEKCLLEHAIPAAHRAGIQVVYLNWGLTDEDLADLPPVLFRAFGTQRVERDDGSIDEVITRPGLGEDMGTVTLTSGAEVSAGRKLMRSQWNTALHPPLQESYVASQTSLMPDVVFHKNRISGFSSHSTPPPIHAFLRGRGITTLLFAGVNTDQCVLGSLQDACNAGFDAVLLRDCVGTNSPEFARMMVEFNCRRTWGFVSEGKDLSCAVDKLLGL